jgi:arylsulfatase
VPAFENQPLQREALYWEHEGNRAIRAGKWKLVAKEKGDWELYDMEADRTEMHNLARSQPALVKQLSDQWQVWAERANVLPLGAWRHKVPKKPRK